MNSTNVRKLVGGLLFLFTATGLVASVLMLLVGIPTKGKPKPKSKNYYILIGATTAAALGVLVSLFLIWI